MFAKVKYLNNKELLAEIHKSKCSYCSFLEPRYAKFDAIVKKFSDITPEFLEATRRKKAQLMLQQQVAELKAQGYKSSQINLPPIDPESIPMEDVVIRVMTYDHIPTVDMNGKPIKNAKDGFEKCNFPPFQHVIFSGGELKCVGKSHWKGGFHNGSFDTEHGRTTERLAMMYMSLVERYGQKSNWRGYCVDETTEALTKRGWVGINEINDDDLILSYDNGELKWSKIFEIYRGHYSGKMFKMTNRNIDSLVTPGHKFVTTNGLKKAEYLLESDSLVLTGNAVKSDEMTYSDDFVELVGWFVTEGNIHHPKDRAYPRVSIYQNEGDNANRIRKCLTSLGAKFNETTRKDRINVRFSIDKNMSSKLVEVANNKVLSMDFINALTTKQRDLLIRTMVAGDGWKRGESMSYSQNDEEHVNAFLALCAISGYRTSYTLRNITSFGKQTTIYQVNIWNGATTTKVENIDFHGGKRKGTILGKGKITHPNEPTVDYDGMVWCPKTEYGCFMARRNGTVYLTGNTYLDEMKAQALLQLSQRGLYFDESCSDNPFAYYTTIVKNSFTRILNIEKKNQSMRDDILIMSGVNPSMTRQVDNEMAYRGDMMPSASAGKPGRKKATTKPVDYDEE